MKAAGFFLFTCAVACASAQRLPPGNELEHAEGSDSAEPNTVGDSRMPNQSAELARAFDPPAPVTPPPRQLPAAPPPVEPDLSAQERDDFARRLDEAKKLVASAQWDKAGPELELLAGESERFAPADAQAVLELQVKAALAQKEFRAGRKAAEKWLLVCGPERVEACRGKAVGALKKLASQKSPDASYAKADVTAAKTADDCLVKVEAAGRSKGALPGCTEGALQSYRSHGDKLQVARIQLAKAQVSAADPVKRPNAGVLYEHAAQACDEPRCVAVKRRALKLAGWLELEGGDPVKAARLMLEEMRLGAERLPTDKRRYARTTEVDKVCNALDARDGAGACRKLEKVVIGDYVFKDFSAQKEKAGLGLAAETVRTVNEHYNVSLQECLAAEASRLKPPAYETYQVNWMVLNDGRVDQVHLARKDQDDGELALCLRRVFVVWRYPRYEGEAQHVEQSFTVSARERR